MANLICRAQIIRTGGQPILTKGFCYSKTEDFPTLDNSDSWPVLTPLDDNNEYSATITDLDPNQYYYVSSYVTNASGIDYSNITSGTTTKGVSVLPTLTIYILKNGIETSIFEMGTENFLVVSGETTKNDETVFNNLKLYQTSVPTVYNPIKTWNGFILKYSTLDSPPITVNFSPRHNQQSSWIMTQESIYNCGTSPTYNINAIKSIDAVFPFLWVLKGSYIINLSYFNPDSPTQEYFYYEASSSNPSPYNGKRIIIKPDKYVPISFLVTPNTASRQYLHLGYPSYYGDIDYSLDNINWTNPGTMLKVGIVGTGSYGGTFGISNSWTQEYKILGYKFNTLSSTPLNFYIRFK